VSEAPAILARHLRFAYEASPRPAAFGLHIPFWEVKHGARVALFGPSGCGKSTVLNLVAGLLAARAGSLEVDGRELVGLAEGRRRAHRISRIGFVFQDSPLVESLDAEQNVLLPFRLHRDLRLDHAARSRARLLLADLGLADKERHLPHRLSQGERQRVALARALVVAPRLLLADEPTAGLDPQQSAGVLDLLENLVREHGLTLVLVSHDPALLARFPDVIAVADWIEGALPRATPTDPDRTSVAVTAEPSSTGGDVPHAR